MTLATNNQYVHFEANDFPHFQEWLDRLPIAHPLQAGELMYKFLRYLSSVDISDKDLFQTLEYCQPVLKFLWHGLRKYYLGVTSMPYEDKGHIIYLANSLEDLTADHYAYYVKQKSADQIAIDPTHAIAVQRAMYHLTHQLVNYYQLSAIQPKGVWYKLNRLYMHAKKFNFLDKEIDFSPKLPDLKTSIKRTYIQALLLASCDPYQLRYNEIDHLYQALFAWTKMADLDEKNKSGVFIIKLNSDHPPHYQALEEKEVDGELSLGIETTKICHHIRDILTQKEDSKLTNKIIDFMGERLLLYLSRIWSSPYTRKFPRWDEEGEVKVIVGFDAVYQKFFNIQSGSKEKNNQSESKFYIWEVVNVAPEGFCLITTGNETQELLAKELIAIKPSSKNDDLPWHLACVRWVTRVENSDVLKVGIEMLSPEVKVVDTHLENVERKTLSPGLMIPQNKSKYADYDLILPPVVYNSGDIVHINGDDFEYQCEVLEVPVFNDSFVQAKVKYLKEFDHLGGADEGRKSEGDQLWNEI